LFAIILHHVQIERGGKEGEKMRKSLTIFMLITALVLLSPGVSGLVISPVCTAPSHQTHPAISGDTIVWADLRNDATTGWDIYKWDPVNGEQPICATLGDQMSPAIFGDTVVWATQTHIYKWDPVNGEQLVCTEDFGRSNPAIFGDTIVWEDERDWPDTGLPWDDIYKWDPVNGEQLICATPEYQGDPAISGDTIVWVDSRYSDTTGAHIYKWDPVNGEQPVCDEPGGQWFPDISGDTIVWADWRNDATTGADIYMWDPLNGEQPVCTAVGDQISPAISGNIIVWVDDRNSATTGSDIYMWDPVNGEQPVCTEPGNQQYPAISGNTIVWEDDRNFATTGWDIYMASPGNPPDACSIMTASEFVCMDEWEPYFQTWVANVTFAGGGHDYDGDLAWLVFGFSVDPLSGYAVPCDPPSESCYAEDVFDKFYVAGATTVTLSCQDAEGLYTEDTVSFYILPHDRCGDLTDWKKVPDTFRDIDHTGIQLALEDKFYAAFDSLFEYENEKEASNILDSMIHLLKAQKNKKITEAQYNELVEYINTIDPEPIM
jgi:beta propeller repeat protein